MSGFPTIQCPKCGAFERLGTEKCFSCGAALGDPGGRREPAGADRDREANSTATRTASSPSAGPANPEPFAGLDSDPNSTGYGSHGSAGTTTTGQGYGSSGPFDGYGEHMVWGTYGTYGAGHGYNPAGGHPYGYGYGYGVAEARLDKGARTALILGIASLVCIGIVLGPVAVIEGNKARRRIAESQGMLTGEGLALAGMILGGVGAVLHLLLIILQIVLAYSGVDTFL